MYAGTKCQKGGVDSRACETVLFRLANKSTTVHYYFTRKLNYYFKNNVEKPDSLKYHVSVQACVISLMANVDIRGFGFCNPCWPCL